MEARIAGEPELRHLLSVTVGLCGSSGWHNDYFCRKSSNKAGIISFLYFGPVHRQSYIPHNNITKGPCNHVTPLHTLTHSLTLYLVNEELSVCVSYTPVSTAWLHHSVMNNRENTSQLFKQIIRQRRDSSDLQSVNMKLFFSSYTLR